MQQQLQQQRPASAMRRAWSRRPMIASCSTAPTPLSAPLTPDKTISATPGQLPEGFQTAVYKNRAVGPVVPVFNGGSAVQAPASQRDQRPALSAIYPRGSVCAVVLGGGEADSRRLFPLTEKRTLPAIPVGATYRLIDIPLSCLINSGIRKIFVLTQYQSTSLNKYIQHTYELHGGMPMAGDGFMEVVSATQGPKEQRWAEGPADTVRQWWSMFKGNSHERFIEDVIVLPSDQVYDIDFEQLVDFHRHHLGDLTIVCRPVEERLVDHFGIVKLGANTSVTSFEEKPQGELKTTMSMDFEDCQEFLNEPHLMSVPFGGDKQDKTWVGSCGMYVFRKEALDRLLLENPRAKDFGRELIPQAIKTMKVFAYNHGDYWADIGGSIAEFYDFNIKLAKAEIPFDFSNGQFYGTRDTLPPNRLDQTRLTNVLIGTGCHVKSSTIRNSVIGPRSIIGDGCLVEESIIMGSDYYSSQKEWSRPVSATYPDIGLGQNCVVRKTIVDKNARIGNNVQLVNAEGLIESMDRIGTGVSIREGVIIVSKSAVVPDNTVV